MEELKRCKYCRATQRVIKKGTRKTRRGAVQIYRCLNCFRYFTYDPGFLRMRYSKEIITKSIDLWVKGNSLAKVRDHLRQFENADVNESTILRWTRKYVGQIKNYTDNLPVVNSNRWSVDETAIILKGKMPWLWEVIDSDTRFLLATHISDSRYVEDAEALYRKALEVSSTPKEVSTDGLSSYVSSHKEVFGDAVSHRTPKNLYDKMLNNQKIERMHGTMKDRLKPMRGLYSQRTAQEFIDALQLYYNFMKPHKSLSGSTPAKVAGLDVDFKQNKWLSLIENANK